MLALALALISFVSLGDEPPVRVPAADAPAQKLFMTTAKTGGLRYSWVLPKGYDGKTPRNLSVILHGTGGDFHWGYLNNPIELFRPADIVISVDGTSPAENSRLFLGEEKNAKLFKEFLAEMRKTFVVDRIFLYGTARARSSSRTTWASSPTRSRAVSRMRAARGTSPRHPRS